MKNLKDLKFPKLKREQLKKINAGHSHNSGFYNDNDDSGGGGPRTCHGWACRNGIRMWVQVTCSTGHIDTSSCT
ncbi:hypothetical protein J8281_03780 [Aquimarina sp. U1-2]|uniref:hypothetical protein n=1 Tax=Aquimarina sp. U1-2 TaxID=2823141 RepID=UPI001AEC783C|nr:hypothetical protein [Aquimarina sp. U1-2]MBP2831298.1 hypothetical protein [Aquimarina sp. U1-2]